MNKLFAAALIAMMQESRVESPAKVDIAVPLSLEVWAVLADSLEDAHAQAFKHALELWPTSAGWFGHTAKVAEVRWQPFAPTIEAEDTLPERIM